MENNTHDDFKKTDQTSARPIPSFQSIPFNRKLNYIAFNNYKLGPKIYEKLPLEVKRFKLTAQGKVTVALLLSISLVTFVCICRIRYSLRKFLKRF